MNKDRDQFAERWMDEALKRYSDAEPREGFEARLMARLAAEKADVSFSNVGQRRRLRWPVWAPVAVAALVVVGVIGVARWRSSGGNRTVAQVEKATIPLKPKPGLDGAPSGRNSESASTLAARTQDTRPVEIASSRHPHSSNRSLSGPPRNVVAKKAEPRREQFPTPTPLTEQEKLLLAYLKATPVEEIQNVAAMQQRQREEAERRAKELDGGRQNASPQSTTEPEINHMQFSPLGNGTADSDARGAR